MSDPVSGTYRSKEEVEAKKSESDPISILRDKLFAADLLSEDELKAIDADALETIADAVRFAEESSPPPPEALYTQVYAEINEHGRLFFDGRER
jgi:pyruvate dehydrogenase E1 component alpha subunit